MVEPYGIEFCAVVCRGLFNIWKVLKEQAAEVLGPIGNCLCSVDPETCHLGCLSVWRLIRFRQLPDTGQATIE
jgi:hypothetical protein